MVDLKKKPPCDYEHAKEYVMLKRLFDKAWDFYKNPKNQKAFKKWKKNKEAQNYGTNNAHT